MEEFVFKVTCCLLQAFLKNMRNIIKPLSGLRIGSPTIEISKSRKWYPSHSPKDIGRQWCTLPDVEQVIDYQDGSVSAVTSWACGRMCRRLLFKWRRHSSLSCFLLLHMHMSSVVIKSRLEWGSTDDSVIVCHHIFCLRKHVG